MTTIDEQQVPRSAREVEPRPSITGGASSLEALLGGGAAVLGILGLVGIAPMSLAAVGTIATGAALITEAGVLANRARRVISYEDNHAETIELGGTSVELIAGIAGVALGILALLGIVPMILLSVSVLVFGGAFVLGAAAAAQLENAITHLEARSRSRSQHIAHETVLTSAGARIFVGLGAIVLGILSLTDIAVPLTLVLIAVLALGAGLLLGGAAVGGRLYSAFH